MMQPPYPVNPVDPVGFGFGQDLQHEQDGFGFACFCDARRQAAENAKERRWWRDWYHKWTQFHTNMGMDLRWRNECSFSLISPLIRNVFELSLSHSYRLPAFIEIDVIRPRQLLSSERTDHNPRR